MTTLHVIKHQFHDSWDTAWAILPSAPSPRLDIMKVKDPICSPWENGRKAKATPGTRRTFPIKWEHWLFQFHGGESSKESAQGIYRLEMHGSSTIYQSSGLALLWAVQASLFSNGFGDMFLWGGKFIQNGKGGMERHCGSSHLLFPACDGGGAPTWGNLRSRVRGKQTQMAEDHSWWKDLCLSGLGSIHQ